MMKRCLSVFAVACAACAAPSDPTAPDVESVTLTPEQNVTDGAWTMTANKPQLSFASAYSPEASVRGAIGYTTTSGAVARATGACLLLRVEIDRPTQYNACGEIDNEGTLPVPCSANSDCAQYAYGFSGGSAYCAAPNNVGDKYCWVRPGSQSDFCTGSPATGQPVSPGATVPPTGWKDAWAYGYGWEHIQWTDCRDVYQSSYNQVAHWMMYGCFSGCSGSTPTPSYSDELVVNWNGGQLTYN